MNFNNLKIIFVSALFLLSGCAARSVRFQNRAPVRYFNDINPIPQPKSVHPDRFDYFATSKPPQPTFRSMPHIHSKVAKDVNSVDEVPASSWFIPRLSAFPMTPEELVAGNTEFGPPVLPISVIKIRQVDRNPRFFVRDQRNIFYLIKFDPPGFPGIATSTSFITNRLFWGFGYNVPEDHLFSFKASDLRVDPASQISEQELRQLMQQTAAPINGQYRAIASRIIEGLPLGPTPAKGVRSEDPNDLFPHEDRRILRALRVFCAFTNMPDISSDNLLDMYVGAPGKGYIKHHFVDFDDAFGTLAARHNQIWAGYNHLFSFRDIVKNFVTLGFDVQDWEKVTQTPWKSVGTFESAIFNPANWKETHPFLPIRRSQPADNYWGAKILATLTPEHLEKLVQATQFPEPGAAEYVLKTLLERREKILDYFFSQVSPIEFSQLDQNFFSFRDLGKELQIKSAGQSTIYQIKIFNDRQRELIPVQNIESRNSELLIPLNPALFSQAKNYLIIQIRVIRGQKTPAPAQFHFLREKNGNIKLVGVIH